MLKKSISTSNIVIPAKAGIHNLLNLQELDSSPNVSIGDKNP